MNRSIVVLGGSFNPPTLAHLKILRAAMERVHAEHGYFVPVSFPYLKRKMGKAGQSHLCLPDETRIRMLKAMTAGNPDMDIYTGEMQEAFAVTQRTMQVMQDLYPDADIFFVAGADKLDLMEEFQRKWSFLTRYRMILFARDGSRLKEEIAAHALLSACQASIVFAPPPEGIETVSSTKIREHLFDPESVAEMLHPAVLPLLKELRPEDFPEEILQFREKYAFLSNDFPVPVQYEDVTYPCAASAFLATKCSDPAERQRIAGMAAEKVKQRYNAGPGSPAWEAARIPIMEEIVRLKFRQHPDLMDRLISTANLRLINGSRKDRFWGVNPITWEGENHLGGILMKLRSEGKKK
ncbi:MAG: NADAR domain-containing protein [Clostridiales bacterium]|nr:NADAR domain-containing protein [Clostridiales bacterium]